MGPGVVPAVSEHFDEDDFDASLDHPAFDGNAHFMAEGCWGCKMKGAICDDCAERSGSPPVPSLFGQACLAVGLPQRSERDDVPLPKVIARCLSTTPKHCARTPKLKPVACSRGRARTGC
jgi:hypothetical protein